MATSSVAIPSQPLGDNEEALGATRDKTRGSKSMRNSGGAVGTPAILDRARGLVAGIAAANAAASTVVAVAAATATAAAKASSSSTSIASSLLSPDDAMDTGSSSGTMSSGSCSEPTSPITARNGQMEGIEMSASRNYQLHHQYSNDDSNNDGEGGGGGLIKGAGAGAGMRRSKRQGSLPPPPPHVPGSTTGGSGTLGVGALGRGAPLPVAAAPASVFSHHQQQQQHQHHQQRPGLHHILRPSTSSSSALSSPSASSSRSQSHSQSHSHRIGQSNRISKIRHQRTSSSNSQSSISAAAIAAVADAVASLSSTSSCASTPGVFTPADSDGRPSGRNTRSNSDQSTTSTVSATSTASIGTNIDGGCGNVEADGAGLSSSSSASSSTTTSAALPSSSPPLSSASTSTSASYNNVPGKAKANMAATTATTTSTKRKSTAPHTSSMSLDDEPPVLSFWGPDPVPLPSRFTRIKKKIIAGHEAELEACWARLIHALRDEVEHIEGLGAHLIPSIEYADVDDPAQTARFGRDLRRYGVGVVRKVVPKPDADSMVNRTVDYLSQVAERNTAARPHAVPQDPTCFDLFWTPAQVRARAHPSVLRAQRFMMSLWETTPDDRLATRLPIAYVDRIRIHGDVVAAAASAAAAAAAATSSKSAKTFNLPFHGSEDAKTAAASTAAALRSLQQPAPASALEKNARLNSNPEPQSADDWIEALQSSAGVIAQVDNGSLERWEPDGYQRGGTYDHVFHGHWEDYDPWECASRVSATMDLYNGYGACTIFRMFQGVLALSTIEPGMIRLLPSPKLATAYYLLRPFFSPRKPAPHVRSGPEWDAYLHPNNWKLERNPDTIIHGAVPGHAQRITEHWHPHLYLRSSMITLPTLQPGDYIFWHPDLPYHISSNNSGLRTPSANRRPDDISMLVYIPAAPLTQTNALYLARQRKAFQRGLPGPDFDSLGRAVVVEDHEIRPGEKYIADVGGPSALQAMGLAPWEAAATRACTPPPTASPSGKDEDTDMSGAADQLEARSIRSSTSGSHAEAEVIRLSNIILFPDRSMLGYSV